MITFLYVPGPWNGSRLACISAAMLAFGPMLNANVGSAAGANVAERLPALRMRQLPPAIVRCFGVWIVTLAAARGGGSRPERRCGYTWARWNETTRGATIDSGRLYTTSQLLSGATFGLEAEAMW